MPREERQEYKFHIQKVVTHNVEKLFKNSLKKAVFKNLSLKLGGAESDNVRACPPT